MFYFWKENGSKCEILLQWNSSMGNRANKMIKGAQYTVCWHVDDLKISHVDKDVVTEVCDAISNKYKGKCKIHRGGVHDYLGMDLDFESEPGVLIISMIKYLQKIIEEW